MPLLPPVTITLRPVWSGMSVVLQVVIGNIVGADYNDVNDNFIRYAAPRMSARPYHHGNLRTALLEQAERTVRERGAQALSLRELARDAGVSHGAPRRHFPDRQALLDALAEAGFVRLGAELRVRSRARARPSWRGCRRPPPPMSASPRATPRCWS